MARTSKLEPPVVDPSEQLGAMFDDLHDYQIEELILRAKLGGSSHRLIELLRSNANITPRLRSFIADVLEGRPKLSPEKPVKLEKRLIPIDAEDTIEHFKNLLCSTDPRFQSAVEGIIAEHDKDPDDGPALPPEEKIGSPPDGAREIKQVAIKLTMKALGITSKAQLDRIRHLRKRDTEKKLRAK